MEIITKNPQETQKLAQKLAGDILFRHPERKRRISKRFFGLRPQNDRDNEKMRAVVIALEGDLGGGKTTFVQGFAKGLGVKEKILSPTFVLIKRFTLRHTQGAKIKNKNFSDFYHIDCYRINNAREISDLYFEKIINNQKNIVMIEWAERIKEILPKKRIDIRFKWVGERKRKIVISGLKKIRN